MNTCARIATTCTGQPDRVVRLTGIREPRGMCLACLDAATRLGMGPVALPEWQARGFRGELGAKDYTGALAGASPS